MYKIKNYFIFVFVFSIFFFPFYFVFAKSSSENEVISRISKIINSVENFRLNTKDKFQIQKESFEIKSQRGIDKKNLESKRDFSKFLEPIFKVLVFIFWGLVFIFSNIFIFYSVLLFFIFVLLRYLWRRAI